MTQTADYWLQTSDFEAIPARELCLTPASGQPKVSVLMLAWNHGKYIDQSIRSIITQECDFPFELVIGEDCSSDDTRFRCRSWQREYPDKVRIITSDNNVGMHANFARIWHRARAPLIAFCEGDDYWVDSTKLDLQVNWFHAHSQSALLGTLTDRVSKDPAGNWTVSGQCAPPEVKEHYCLGEMLRHYSFHFSSVMIRKSAVHFPRWFWDVYCVDRPLYILAAKSGKSGLLPVVTSHYRQHAGGRWSTLGPLDKAVASTALFDHLELHLGRPFRDTCRETLASILWSYMSEAIKFGDRSAARKLFWQSIWKHPKALFRAQGRNIPAAGLRLHWPALYHALGGSPIEGKST